MRILGICGSLRKGSLNHMLLRAAQGLVPEGTSLDVAELHGVPPFDEDLEAQGDPDAVRRLKERIRDADAVLISTPEYAWGVAGVLKNGIDWVARPIGRSFLKQKPVAVMGVTDGPWGTTRAQLQLRQTLTYLDALTLPAPSLFVASGKDKFDASGALTDERVRDQLRTLVAALVTWTERVRPPA